MNAGPNDLHPDPSNSDQSTSGSNHSAWQGFLNGEPQPISPSPPPNQEEEVFNDGCASLGFLADVLMFGCGLELGCLLLLVGIGVAIGAWLF